MISSWPYAKNLSLYYTIHLVVFLATLVVLFIASYTGIRIEPAPLVQYNTYECDTGNKEADRTFRLLAFSEPQGVLYADSLCSDPILQGAYSNVSAIWQHREIDKLRVIFDLPFDLMIAKKELIERPEINLNNAYVPIATYHDYSSRFISLESQPQLTDSYLQGKVMGLMYSPVSVSGHKVPRQALDHAGVDEQLIHFEYYNSHPDLYRALLNGEVDIIASGIVLSPEQLQARRHYMLPMQSGLKAPRWYLHPQLANTKIHCQILSMLETRSNQSEIPLEQGLIAIEPCTGSN